MSCSNSHFHWPNPVTKNQDVNKQLKIVVVIVKVDEKESFHPLILQKQKLSSSLQGINQMNS